MNQGNQGSKYYHRNMKIKFKNGGIYTYDKEADAYFYLCRYLNVKEVRTNILTGDVEVVLEYNYNNEKKIMTTSRDIFIKNKILNLLPAKGVDVTDRNVLKVIDYLLYIEQYANYTNVHEQIGWAEINGHKIYLLEDVLGANIKSKYHGELNIKPKGTYEMWKEVIEKEVIGNNALELALVLGLSSPIASLLKRILGLDVLFFHLSGDSTTGKTTALALATSAFGFPSKNNNGLIKTWLATDNAILGYLNGIHGLPIAIDEASVRIRGGYTNMIYQIVDGIEKGRMNRNGENKNRGEWSGTVISTAENSLLTHSNENNGLRVRLMELRQIKWTTSAENAENLKSVLIENYGHAGKQFVEYLLTFSDEKILEMFKKSKKIVKSKIQVMDSFTDRITDKIATIYLTAYLINKALKLNLDIEKILKILIDADAQQVEDRNIGLKAYEFLKEFITKNLNKFIHKVNLDSFAPNEKEAVKELPKGEIIGRLESQGDKITQVLIPKEQLKKLLEEGGFTDIDLILGNWRDKKVIDTDNNKFTKKRSLFKKGISVRVVVINIDNDIDDEAGLAPNRRKKRIFSKNME